MSILSYLICLLLRWNQEASRSLVIITLVVILLLATKLLLDLLGKKALIGQLILVVNLILLVWQFQGNMLPACAVILSVICYELLESKYYYYPLIVAIILSILIMRPSVTMILLTVLLLAIMLITIYLTGKIDAMRDSIDSKSKEITELNNKVNNQKQATRAIEEYARMKERNRIAGRVHDKMGHGISGSILLLEGAMLVMDKDPENAKSTVESAAENLRLSVDEIRETLREERSSRDEMGISNIKTELARLSSDHNHIKTSLKSEGQLDNVSPEIWYCINENIKEAITNLILHSTATTFSIFIGNQDKLLRVEIKDNGKVEKFKVDMGLQNMEERCAMVNGKCYFQGDDSGFRIVMVFKGDLEYDD